MHPLYLSRYPVTFEEQFSDTTPFPQNTVVSLDFPSVTSVAATRFFDKCYATAALGNTVILVGGFRDRPTNRRVRRVLAQRAPGDSQHAMVLLTFPGRSFPAGTIRGWPESPDADEQEHPEFSMHMRFGVPTQPLAMDSRQVNRHANLATHPCNTQVIVFSPRPSDQAEAITPERIYHLTSVLKGILVPHRTRGDRFPLLWRKWSDSSLPLRFTDWTFGSNYRGRHCEIRTFTSGFVSPKTCASAVLRSGRGPSLVRTRVMADCHRRTLRPRGRPRPTVSRLIVRCSAREFPVAMGPLRPVWAARRARWSHAISDALAVSRARIRGGRGGRLIGRCLLCSQVRRERSSGGSTRAAHDLDTLHLRGHLRADQ